MARLFLRISYVGFGICVLIVIAGCVYPKWGAGIKPGLQWLPYVDVGRHFAWTDEAEVRGSAGLDGRYEAAIDWRGFGIPIEFSILCGVVFAIGAGFSKVAMRIGGLKTGFVATTVAAAVMCIYVPTGEGGYGFIWDSVPELTRLFVQLLGLSFILLLLIGFARYSHRVK